mgnify:CR=1 FL=1
MPMIINPYRFGGGGGGGGAFTPSTDGSLLAHWDASDTGSISQTANVVSSIADQTANGYTLDVQGTPTDMLTNVDTQNGLNVVTTPNSAVEKLVSADFTTGGGLTINGNLAVHMVVDIGVPTATNHSLLSVNGNNGYVEINSSSTTQFDGNMNADNVDTAGSNQSLSGGPFSGYSIVSMIFDWGASTVTCYIGGTLRGTIADYNLGQITASGDCDVRPMCNRGANLCLPGHFAECCVTQDLTNRSDYETYLGSKWGV